MAYSKTIWTEVLAITATLLNKIEDGIEAAHNAVDNLTLSWTKITDKPFIPPASSATPSNLGVSNAGTSTSYARSDHVHQLPSLSALGAQKTITSGTTAPSGGVDGDIYIQY
jgi:hypothetical protein